MCDFVGLDRERIGEMPIAVRLNVWPKNWLCEMVYHCLSCREEYGYSNLLYTCPKCGGILLLRDNNFSDLGKISVGNWRMIFDYRRMLTVPALKGIFRFRELIAPAIPLDRVVYLGEGNTPMIEARRELKDQVGCLFFFKNDGQNPSLSFKDRGMACALSYVNRLARADTSREILVICASTGDTSASAALYASYLPDNVKTAVLLPHGKVTPEQLSQPLGSGARVFEIPGVFDDCMKVVEALSEKYDVALVNSKNPWRILGQETYAFEIAQDFGWRMKDKVIFVPIGNAGNITAVMSGFLKLLSLDIISYLPKIVGVQSEHADPVYQYFRNPGRKEEKFKPVVVKPSVAQAAMIGNPVSMPRVVHFVDEYEKQGGVVHIIDVKEQDIMEWTIRANWNGHIACTHGGECLAGLAKARVLDLVLPHEVAVLDSTAHALKFAGFTNRYNQGDLKEEFGIVTNPELCNYPVLIKPETLSKLPAPGKPLQGKEMQTFVEAVSEEIAHDLCLQKKKK